MGTTNVWTIKVQYVLIHTFKKLDNKGKCRIQSIVGTFLYYRQAIEQPIQPALNEIPTYQTNPMTDMAKKTNMLMVFLATHPSVKLQFYTGPIQLCIESDAVYHILYCLGHVVG